MPTVESYTSPTKPLTYMQREGLFNALSDYTQLEKDDKDQLKAYAVEEMNARGIPVNDS